MDGRRASGRSRSSRCRSRPRRADRFDRAGIRAGMRASSRRGSTRTRSSGPARSSPCRPRLSKSTRRASPTRGRWPWPRDVLAELVAAIQRYQPAAIGVDIFMPEADALSPERLLARDGAMDPELARRLAALPSNDTVLARALGCRAHRAGDRRRARGHRHAGARAAVRRQRRAWAAAAHRSGFRRSSRITRACWEASMQLDRRRDGTGSHFGRSVGGVIRRVPLVASIDGTLVPALAIEMLRVARRRAGAAARRGRRGRSAASASADSSRRPRRTGPCRIYYSPRNTDRYVSAIDVLDGRSDPAQLRGQAGPDRSHRPGLDRRQEHTAGRGDARRRDPCAAPGKPVRRDARFAGRPGRRRSRLVLFFVLGALLVAATPRWKPRNAAALALAGVLLLRRRGRAWRSAHSGCCSMRRIRRSICCCSSASCSC